MAVPPNNRGPARGPVRIPPLSTIIKEGDREIGSQVRRAVERAVTAGIAVDPIQLRKWGPAGGRYFAKTLRERIMPPPQKVAAKPDGPLPASGAAIGHAGTATIDHGKHLPKKPVERPRRSPVIRTEKDWREKESGRCSVAMRALSRGLFVAACLLLLTVVVLRPWS